MCTFRISERVKWVIQTHTRTQRIQFVCFGWHRRKRNVSERYAQLYGYFILLDCLPSVWQIHTFVGSHAFLVGDETPGSNCRIRIYIGFICCNNFPGKNVWIYRTRSFGLQSIERMLHPKEFLKCPNMMNGRDEARTAVPHALSHDTDFITAIVCQPPLPDVRAHITLHFNRARIAHSMLVHRKC